MDSIDKTHLNSLESLGLTKQPPREERQAKLGQEDFMKLMLTQMNSQDPFKPMEDGEFLSQMAQFSAVSGLKEIKDSFLSLSDSLKSNQALQASSMVGRKVMIPGSVAVLPAAGEIQGAVDLPSSTSKLTINVYDAQGELVHSIDKGNQAEGLVQFSWNGMRKLHDAQQQTELEQRAMPGTYTVKAEFEFEGKGEAVDTLVVDTVDSVSLGRNGQGITLNLAHAGSQGMHTVRQIM
jgi:flagellar basal-body rod modification protein FlgD